MSSVQSPATQRLILHGEPWGVYVHLLRLFDERRHFRITYDREALEIMTLSPEHAQYSRLFGRFATVLTEELNWPIASYGSMTMKRRKRQRGLEPDECFWIQNEASVRNLKIFNLRRDPPPDLAVEIDISRSSLNRLAIYAALRVPEVWRFDGLTVTFHVLGADGKYALAQQSRAFPLLAPTDLARFAALRGQMDENAVIRQFRAWVRQQIAATGSRLPSP